MATGRTTMRWARFYADGNDWSGSARQFGPLKQEFAASPEAAISDQVKNEIAGHATLGVGTLNAFLDNTPATGIFVAGATAGGVRTVMCPIGIRALPAVGDPVYAGQFPQLTFQAKEQGEYIVVDLALGNAADNGATLAYVNPWGVLLHANGAETAVNTSAGLDDWGAATAYGGWLCYQLFASNGTVTLKCQDAATNLNASFADLSGATSGAIDASATPAAGVVALARTATVRRYLRWQIVFGTATTATFALSFHRATF